MPSVGPSPGITKAAKVISYSETEKVVPRFTINDVSLTSDHPFRSFLRISRGAGYAQYGGLPVIIESSYHISSDEYRRRKTMPWPTLPGMFYPGRAGDDDDDTKRGVRPTRPRPEGPVWTEEVIRDKSSPLPERTPNRLMNSSNSSSSRSRPQQPRRERKRP